MNPTDETVDRLRRARRGFTLLEMMLSMTLMLAVIGLSTKLFRSQANAVANQTGRLDAQQNSHFALNMFERELRVAGAGVVDQQPMLVMGGPTAVTFNANLTTLDENDPSAVYANRDIDPAATTVMRTADAYELPGTMFTYPSLIYTQSGTNAPPSNAETITYWMEKDSSTTYENEYILWRRVNGLPPRVVARGLYYDSTQGTPPFRYFKNDKSGARVEIQEADLPLIHTATIHGDPTDINAAALPDSIREVRAQFTSVFHRSKAPADTVMRQMNLIIQLKNAMLPRRPTCGPAPSAPTNISAVVSAADGITVLQTFVTLTWNASDDEGGSEKDVDRYAIYRRPASANNWSESLPIASMPAGQGMYTFQDMNFHAGDEFIYGVTALDCTPLASAIVSSAPVKIPENNPIP
jgi:prepilin-type N-terminal cleavage/methylation domain-containing protein